jgi:tRNA(fMet)-specific endonuclease VapC
MSLYAMDTDTLTLFEKGHPVVIRKVLQHSPDEIATTVLSVEEQLSGWYAQLRRAKKTAALAKAYKRLAGTVRFLADLQILDFTESGIARYQELLKLKLKVGRTDLRIAATTLEYGAVLVSRNTRTSSKFRDCHLRIGRANKTLPTKKPAGRERLTG